MMFGRNNCLKFFRLGMCMMLYVCLRLLWMRVEGYGGWFYAFLVRVFWGRWRSGCLGFRYFHLFPACINYHISNYWYNICRINMTRFSVKSTFKTHMLPICVSRYVWYSIHTYIYTHMYIHTHTHLFVFVYLYVWLLLQVKSTCISQGIGIQV